MWNGGRCFHFIYGRLRQLSGRLSIVNEIRCGAPHQVAEFHTSSRALGSYDEREPDESEKASSGRRRRERNARVFEILGLTKDIQSMNRRAQTSTFERVRKESAKRLDSNQHKKSTGVAADGNGESGFDPGVEGKPGSADEDLIVKLLDQLNAYKERDEPEVFDPDPIFHSKDPSIEFRAVVEEIRAASGGKTSSRYLGKRKPVTKEEMEGVECSRDKDFARGAFESPQQRKFIKQRRREQEE